MDAVAFAALLERCAPEAPIEPLTAIVRQASSFEPLLITIDGRKPIPLQATNREEAIQLGTEAAATGQPVRVGLAQLRPADMKQAGITISAAFDGCKHIAAVGRLFDARLQAARVGERSLTKATMTVIASFAPSPMPDPSDASVRKAPPAAPAHVGPVVDGSTADDPVANERASWDVYRSKRGVSVFVYER